MRINSFALRVAACFALALLPSLISPPTARAIDRIRLLQGSQQNGDIVETTATEVTVQIGVTKKTVPVNEIDVVQFDDESNQLTQARIAVRAGRYGDALTNLKKLTPENLTRPLLAEDAQFFEALATARLALTGSGEISDAGKMMLTFEKSYPDSYHHFEACEVVGDLLVGMGKFSVADSYYGKFAAAPWPEYQLRAAVLSGRALVGQKKFEQAIAKFDSVQKTMLTGKLADTQKVAAQLGKASALSGAGKHAEAIQLVEEVIAKAAPDDDEVYARAYNEMGSCYEASKQPQEAIVAYLHTDLLYSRSAAQHAEALGHLVDLFTEDKKPQRAAMARETLKSKYKLSGWANK